MMVVLERGSMEGETSTSGHVLVICEKPDAARRISDALAQGSMETVTNSGVVSFSFLRDGEKYKVCAAQGHLYDASDTFQERSVYPVFDVEWFPHYLIDKNAHYARRRIEAIRSLSQDATRFINACDFDIEGETIGHNLLKYACGGKEASAIRARFSTLTKEEIVRSFRDAKVGTGSGPAAAGRARHVLDFVWGVNLSRALSLALVNAGGRYRTVTVGRVQGPTLAYVVQRELEIKTFVPRPFWKVRGVFTNDRVRVEADYGVDRIWQKSDAEAVVTATVKKEGIVMKLGKTLVSRPAPYPFNIGDLQKEAYRVFRFAPSRTLQLSERLYLDALISYPRTSSQKFPNSIDVRRILTQIAKSVPYSVDAAEVLRGNLRPNEGPQSDPAHPAIYPTGETPRKALGTWEAQLLDLIIRRFLSTFGRPAIQEKVEAVIAVKEHRFLAGGVRLLDPGWMSCYGRYARSDESAVPPLEEGERLAAVQVDSTEKFELGPHRYTQSSLLEKMEMQKLGTKATRAEVIATLIRRGYVTGENLQATDFGFAVVETLQKHSPEVLSTKLTRDTEDALESIETGGNSRGVMETTVELLSRSLSAMKSNQPAIGSRLEQSAMAAGVAERELGPCPSCKTGKLIVIHSRKTHKRFVGCTNFSKGCRASAPLPQRGTLKTVAKPCVHCGWPVVMVWNGRRFPWRLCVNLDCLGKSVKKNELPTVQR
jgi:DNA topoisomerase-1